MLSIFRRSKAKEIDFSQLGSDMHSHLLPALDDGSPDVPASDALITGLRNLGYKKLITTPHVMADIYPNTPTTIESALTRLQKESTISRNNLPVPAAEYLLDDGFEDILNQQQSLMCISGSLVLVEFSFAAPPVDFKEKLFQLQLQGYQPVLAHPERYVYWLGNKRVMDELRTAGCLFAINILSFTGHYGKPCADAAHAMMKKNLIDFVGTDCHHPRHIEMLQQAHQVMPIINQLLDKGNLKNPAL
jgi:protein-tyrosine phosphatase